MKTSHFAVINLVIGVLLLSSPFVVQVTTSAGVYDPWSDLNADGEIDIFDVVTVAGAYRTTGDPTKSVYVQNWPVTTQQTVFYQETGEAYSDDYNASGFGHVHLIWYVGGLGASESVTLPIYVTLYTPAGGFGAYYAVQSLEITAANYRGGLSFPVPAETFGFATIPAAGTTAYVSLAFYLTYA